MQLQLTGDAFQCSHLDNTGFFQEHHAHGITLDFLGVLNDLRHGANDVNKIIALIKDHVDVFAGGTESAFEALVDHILNEFGVRLVTHFKHIVFCYLFVEA